MPTGTRARTSAPTSRTTAWTTRGTRTRCARSARGRRSSTWRQLGHADTQMVVKVYGRYKPNETERREWERIAALQDAERAKPLALRGA